MDTVVSCPWFGRTVRKSIATGVHWTRFIFSPSAVLVVAQSDVDADSAAYHVIIDKSNRCLAFVVTHRSITRGHRQAGVVRPFPQVIGCHQTGHEWGTLIINVDGICSPVARDRGQRCMCPLVRIRRLRLHTHRTSPTRDGVGPSLACGRCAGCTALSMRAPFDSAPGASGIESDGRCETATRVGSSGDPLQLVRTVSLG
jgi:hypothetical protein